MIRDRTLFVILPIFLVVASCRINTYYEPEPRSNFNPRSAHHDSLNSEVYKNLVYGTDSIQQSMDVYLPAGRDLVNTPVVVMLHGGAWHMGDKVDLDGYGFDSFFNDNKCALLNINYRLDSFYDFPAPIDDIGLVLELIAERSKEWNVNSDRVCLFGISAGGHLALLYAYTKNTGNRIKSVIEIAAPTDLASDHVSPSLIYSISWLLGDDSTNLIKKQNASPVNYTRFAVPTVILHGKSDSVVYFTQAATLLDSLTQYRIPNLYVPLRGEGHVIPEAIPRDWRQPVMDWVKKYL